MGSIQEKGYYIVCRLYMNKIQEQRYLLMYMNKNFDTFTNIIDIIDDLISIDDQQKVLKKRNWMQKIQYLVSYCIKNNITVKDFLSKHYE